jgi:hypothetical protein
MGDELIATTQGKPVGPCGLNETDLALLRTHADDIGQAFAEQIAATIAEPDAGSAYSESVRQYVELLFSGTYDSADRELPNLPGSAYVKIHEVAVGAIIKAHRRNETKLYQTLMAYLRVSQADMALRATTDAEATARPRAVNSA